MSTKVACCVVDRYAEASRFYMLTGLGDNGGIELLYDGTAIAITLTDDDFAAIKALGEL